MLYYTPNNLKALRGTMSLQALSRVSKLGVGRLRLLEENGLPTRVAPKSLEEIAKKLGHTLEKVFPTEKSEPAEHKAEHKADPDASAFVRELILEQTTPRVDQERPTGPRARKVRLLEPVYHDGAWEVPFDAKVASRSVFQDMLSAAEELGGWRSTARLDVVVQGDRKYQRTLLIFGEEEVARSFYTTWSEYPYMPDPPTPMIEVIHRHEEIASPKIVPEGCVLEGATEVLPALEEGDDDGMLVLSAELTPRLMDFYRELKKDYGRGLQKAILIRGITALAADFGL